MRELFFAELKRWLPWAAGLALVHEAVLAFLTRLVDLLQQPLAVFQVFGAVYAAAGLLFGLVQAAAHRRPNVWLHLLHRPVSPRRIAAAVYGAGAALAALVVAAPVALTLAGQALWTARVVDARHLLLPLAALLVALAAYFAGAFAMLGANRWGLLALAVPALAVRNEATGVVWVVLFALATAWLAALAVGAFRPDRATPPRGLAATTGVVLPYAFAIWFLVAEGGGMLIQLGWILFGSHPLNSTPPAGGLVEAQRAESARLFALGLDAAERGGADVALERAQVELSESWIVWPSGTPLPVRGALTNPAPPEIDDATRNARYTYSHDSGRFRGVDLATRAAVAPIGLGGTPGERFPAPPLVTGAWAITPGAVDRYDEATGRWSERLKLPPGETIASTPLAVGEAIALLSNRALLIYEPRRAATDDATLVPSLRVELPAPIGEVARVDLLERLDGYLVSAVVGRGMVDGPGRPFQELLRVDGEGGSTRLARRELAHDFPLPLRTRRFWLSPALEAGERLATSAFAGPRPLAARAPVRYPTSVVLSAIALSVLAAALAARRWAGASPVRRWGATAAAAAGGLPVLAALHLARVDDELGESVARRVPELAESTLVSAPPRATVETFPGRGAGA